MNLPKLCLNWPRHAVVLAAASWLLAVLGFAALVPDYTHGSYPLGWLGGLGMPRAGGFNLLAWMLPGALLVAVAWQLRSQLGDDSHVLARIGSWLLLLAALAFASKGVFVLDLEQLDGGQSRRHASAWAVMVIGFVSGLSLYLVGRWQMRQLSAMQTVVLLAGVFGFVGLTLVAPLVLPAGFVQRAALLLWFVLWWQLAPSAVMMR